MFEEGPTEQTAEEKRRREAFHRACRTVEAFFPRPDFSAVADSTGHVTYSSNSPEIDDAYEKYRLAEVLLASRIVEVMGDLPEADILNEARAGVEQAVGHHVQAQKDTIASQFAVQLEGITDLTAIIDEEGMGS